MKLINNNVTRKDEESVVNDRLEIDKLTVFKRPIRPRSKTTAKAKKRPLWSAMGP